MKSCGEFIKWGDRVDHRAISVQTLALDEVETHTVQFSHRAFSVLPEILDLTV